MPKHSVETLCFHTFLIHTSHSYVWNSLLLAMSHQQAKARADACHLPHKTTEILQVFINSHEYFPCSLTLSHLYALNIYAS